MAVSCGVAHRCGLDLALLWLWCRSAATAPIQPLAWEPPYAAGAALKRQKNKNKKKQKAKQKKRDTAAYNKVHLGDVYPVAIARMGPLSILFTWHNALHVTIKYLWHAGPGCINYLTCASKNPLKRYPYLCTYVGPTRGSGPGTKPELLSDKAGSLIR